jgi:thiol-disulfide isomerase/thioredoxin
VDLYTDGTDAASVANQKLEEEKFQTVAIPFYVLYDTNQNVLATFPGLTRNTSEYLAFLNTSGAAAPENSVAGGSPGNSAGNPLANSPFRTLDGAPISTSDWKGKVVVLNYWATWCVPCRSEIPEFNKMQQELSPKGVEIVGISMDEDGAEAVRTFLKQNPMKYTVGLGSGSLDSALPVTLVLDRNGNTVQRFEGFTKPEEIRAAIAKAQSAG